jgi:peroxiredoxin Q/BCP
MKTEILNTSFEVVSMWEHKKDTLKNLLVSHAKTILYFYPKDNTPWCSIEAKDFSCIKQKFIDLWINIIWVSKDSIESHNKFIEKQELSIDLISDPNLILHKEFWAYWEKNNYWKIIQWVIRSTFLLNNNWEIIKSWKNVKAKWHAEKVLREIV